MMQQLIYVFLFGAMFQFLPVRELPAQDETAGRMGMMDFSLRESRASVEEKLRRMNFNRVPDARPGWEIYESGTQKYQSLQLIAVGFRYSGDRLARITAVMASRTTESVVSDYLTVQKRLKRRLGAPLHDMKAFSHPYRWGDGNELNAIRTNRSHVWTEWCSGGEGGDAFLRLVIVDDHTIRLDCQSVSLMQDIAEH